MNFQDQLGRVREGKWRKVWRWGKEQVVWKGDVWHGGFGLEPEGGSPGSKTKSTGQVRRFYVGCCNRESAPDPKI